MDDSVIKVLRRNGSWNKLEKKTSTPSKEANKKDEEDFSIDKNFGILAEEIKRRMKTRSESKSINDNSNYNNNFKVRNADKIEIKTKILPYLKSIEKITNERDNYLKKIDELDNELEIVKEEIKKIRKIYQKDLDNLKSSINFFDESIIIIDKIKGKG